MKDNAPRRAIKALARAIATVDLAVTRRLQRAAGKRPYQLGGNCALCAACCESPVIRTRGWAHRLPLGRRLFLAWQRRVNGFELQRDVPTQGLFVFRCTHFDPTTRRCDSYGSRPLMCRDYPRTQLWDADPAFLPGCGYRAVSPKAAEVAAAIDADGLHLSEGEREALKRKLHAWQGGEERSVLKSR